MLDLVFGATSASAAAPSFIQEMGQMYLPVLGHKIMAYASFAFYVLLLAGGGLTAVLARNLVRALLGLMVTFLGVAGMYLLMASPYLAFMQLLIYIGAICVLIMIGIKVARNNAIGEEMAWPGPGQAFWALLAGFAPMALFAPILILKAGNGPQVEVPAETPLEEMGEFMLSGYVLPFELISVILLVAMAGAVVLGFVKRKAAPAKKG